MVSDIFKLGNRISLSLAVIVLALIAVLLKKGILRNLFSLFFGVIQEFFAFLLNPKPPTLESDVRRIRRVLEGFAWVFIIWVIISIYNS